MCEFFLGFLEKEGCLPPDTSKVSCTGPLSQVHFFLESSVLHSRTGTRGRELGANGLALTLLFLTVFRMTASMQSCCIWVPVTMQPLQSSVQR